MDNFYRVFLKAKEEVEIVQGFPWVFDNEVSYVKYKNSSSWTQFAFRLKPMGTL